MIGWFILLIVILVYWVCFVQKYSKKTHSFHVIIRHYLEYAVCTFWWMRLCACCKMTKKNLFFLFVFIRRFMRSICTLTLPQSKINIEKYYKYIESDLLKAEKPPWTWTHEYNNNKHEQREKERTKWWLVSTGVLVNISM